MSGLNFIDKKIKYLKERRQEVLETLHLLGIDGEKILGEQESSKRKFSCKVERLSDLKVACIMDEFTLEAYKPECQLLEITPEHWKEEIESFVPDLLFVESAWQGKDNLWYKKIANGSKEYFELTSYCQEESIPIVFWNKEDPVWTDVFMTAAKMADVVFTTDIDCIPKYKTILRHDSVYLLHFAAQPKFHNPIEKYTRKDKYCFAGAYYHKYKKRAEVFDQFSNFFIESKGLEIYDRNYKNSRPEHAFPNRYNEYILGRLEPSEIDVAYKGYNYGINMNSVSQSQTMFARRVFELLASNTVTVGNYSRGVRNVFGDLTISTDDVQSLKNQQKKWCDDVVSLNKYRLLGLRKVLREHLYENRLSYIVEKVFGNQLMVERPKVYLMARVNSQKEADYVYGMISRQSYCPEKCILISDAHIEIDETKFSVEIVPKDLGGKPMMEVLGECYVGIISPLHYYGPNYLMDMILSLKYGTFSGIGKSDYYDAVNGAPMLQEDEGRYCLVEKLKPVCSIINTKLCEEKKLTVTDFFDTESLEADNFLSIDEFNFCANYQANECNIVDDLDIKNVGMSMREMEICAEKTKRNRLAETCMEINTADLKRIICMDSISNISVSQENGDFIFKSEMGREERQYFYLNQEFKTLDYCEEEKLTFLLDGKGDLETSLCCIFYDYSHKKIQSYQIQKNCSTSLEIPLNATYFKLALRFYGVGLFEYSRILLGKAEESSCGFLSRSNILVLTNVYPAPDNLYRNMFVHKRLLEYKQEGMLCDVLRMNIYAGNEYSEFEGIDIVEGRGDALQRILDTGKIDTICVHFLDRSMWEVLKSYMDSVRIIIWSHGADIQPWWRRKFMYQPDEMDRAKKQSEERMSLWNEVFASYIKYDIHFVFVSRYSVNIVEEDYGCKLDENRCHIIPNCIDTELFAYQKKNIEQRKKIISIRPYASAIYGNDIMVKAIQELSKVSYFKEFQFLLVGDGILFDETVKPLRKYKNVEIRKSFLRQQEIRDLYQKYGILLIPTRGDTQGVSRDEGMSCGLVPVTNAVAAIPEFVDIKSGILVKSEDYTAMADGIKMLYEHPEEFLRLSESAAARVRQQTSREHTVKKEIVLIESMR